MARPTKPKDLKPKTAEAEGAETAAKPSGGGGLDLKFLITIVAIFLCSTVASVASIYFIAPMVLVPAILSELPNVEGGHGADEEDGHHGHGSSVGLNLELDEFTVNLKTEPGMSGNQFLRAKMSLSIQVPEEEDCHQFDHATGRPWDVDRTTVTMLKLKPIQYEGAVGRVVGAASESSEPEQLLASGGGEAANPYDTCIHAFTSKMSRYIPAMRDVINSALMKRSADQLATIEGQELLKDDIREQINALLGSKYHVIRVNFEDFIIQR